jgi:DNA repair exonuclease SbcCD ATPase subunit
VTLQEQYDAALAAWRQARSAMLSDRLTLSRKQAQMHEADVEQDDSVADYFANRATEMTHRVAADEEKLAELAAIVEEVRIAMVTEELDATIASYNEALRAIAEHLAAIESQIVQMTELSQRVEELADTLPESATRQHLAAVAVANRTTAIEERLQTLQQTVTASVASRGS